MRDYEPSETVADERERLDDIDQLDFVPHYQRVFISGEESTSVSIYSSIWSDWFNKWLEIMMMIARSSHESFYKSMIT